jgi:uncharacterized protein with GYD domain
MPDEPHPHYVFLLNYTHYEPGEAAKKDKIDDLTDTVRKMDSDAQHWGGTGKAVFLPATGKYDVVVLAEGGSEKEALHFAVYLHRTERYKVMATLTIHTRDELVEVIQKDPDPKRK